MIGKYPQQTVEDGPSFLINKSNMTNLNTF